MRTSIGIVLTIRADSAQKAALGRNAGASRFAWNWCVARFASQREARKENPATKMLYTGFDYIDAFNKWKNSAEAGYSEEGGVGLPWRSEVSAQGMENACADFGKSVGRFFDNLRDRKAQKTKLRVGAPQFKKRLDTKPSFRLRNANGKSFRVTKKGVHVPKVGYLRVREGTNRLRQMLRRGPGFEAGRILFATLSHVDCHWRLSLNLDVDVLMVRQRLWTKQNGRSRQPVVGVDLGIETLACLACPDGSFVQHSLAPQQVGGLQASIEGHGRRVDLKRNARRLRAKEEGKRSTVGVSEQRARTRLQRRHARQRTLRRANLHLLTTDLATRCDVIGIEDLNVSGMLRNHSLARAIASQAWGELRRQLTYKTAWAGSKLVVVDRFFPSSKRCSRCHETKSTLCLAQRTYSCAPCGAVLDRDANAAMNLAQQAQKINNASPEELGKGKTPELEGLGAAFKVHRDLFPRAQEAPEEPQGYRPDKAGRKLVRAR